MFCRENDGYYDFDSGINLDKLFDITDIKNVQVWDPADYDQIVNSLKKSKDVLCWEEDSSLDIHNVVLLIGYSKSNAKLFAVRDSVEDRFTFYAQDWTCVVYTF